ncbi:hypothetical protein TcWFU_007585 [Taenia crassiceps]|uniref:Secreted protein n=1 Tax=Taenia crassiceps TaxID=6207 RepID=A0ABR4QI33_9CEST
MNFTLSHFFRGSCWTWTLLVPVLVRSDTLGRMPWRILVHIREALDPPERNGLTRTRISWMTIVQSVFNTDFNII